MAANQTAQCKSVGVSVGNAWRSLLVGALLLALAGLVLWQMQQPAQSLRSTLPWHMPDVKQVQRIVFHSQFQAPFSLLRQGNDWSLKVEKDKQGTAPDDSASIDAAMVDHELVSRFLQDLSQMRLLRVVARGHQHDAELGMDEGTVVHTDLQDAQGHSLLALDVGRQGALISTFIRQAGGDVIVAVDQALLWHVRRDAKSWLLPSQPKITAQQDDAYQQP